MVVQDGDRIIHMVALNRMGIIILTQISKVELNAHRTFHVYAEQTYAIIVPKTHTMIKKHLTGYANDVGPLTCIDWSPPIVLL